MTNLDKSRDITFLTKVHLVKAMAFPVVMNGCESWTREKPERKELVLEKTPESPLGSKEINPEYPIVRINAEAKASILWPPNAKS